MVSPRGLVRAALALPALMAHALLAGGTSVPVRVVAIDVSSREHQVIRIAPLTTDPAVFPASCTSVTLAVAYRRSRWWRSAGTPSTRAQHAEALRILTAAEQAGTPVQFGVMGQGLSATGTACQFSSHGFQVISEPPGVPTVYSFFRWP